MQAVGENRFLFTFLQGLGKRRAMEDGPWMFGNDLVVLVAFDGAKTIDEIEFVSIPIWVRVTQMSMGLMTRKEGEEIGEMIGETIDVDVDDDEVAIGEYLRIKVWLDIKKPLMRGVTLDLGGDGRENKR